MATLEITFLHGQLEERKRRLETAITLAPQNSGLAGLLREVDSALDRMAKGSYGLCQECHESIEQDRLLADPLVRYCLDHLSDSQRAALQRDLDLAARRLLRLFYECSNDDDPLPDRRDVQRARYAGAAAQT